MRDMVSPKTLLFVSRTIVPGLTALFLLLPAPAAAEGSGLVGARAAGIAQSRPATVASDAKLDQTPDAARLVFDLSAPIDAKAFVLSDPDRVVVELPETDFQLSPQAGKPAARGRPPGLVAAFRFGRLTPGKSRIVIDLAAPARVLRASNEVAGGSNRLVIELAKTDRAAFRAAAHAARVQLGSEPRADNAPSAPVDAAVRATAKPVIVLDPGHGGVDSGAMANGLVEKTIVHDFATVLAAKLEAAGRYKVVMTRTDDTFVTLGDRVRLARDANAALLLSIHADILSEADVAGATVYMVSDRASDAEAARVADQENQSDVAAGLEGREDANGVSDILFDLTRRETRVYSHVFSRALVEHWRSAARLNKNPERAAGFRVLKAPDVPSVLLELGYLSNPKDAAALVSPEWREKATDQVAAAIETFFTGRAVSASPPRAVADKAGGEGRLGLRGQIGDVAAASQVPDIAPPRH